MNDDLTEYSNRDLLVSLHTKVGVITTSIEDHESRVRRLETNMWFTKGAIAILVFISGFIEPFVTWKAHK